MKDVDLVKELQLDILEVDGVLRIEKSNSLYDYVVPYIDHNATRTIYESDPNIIGNKSYYDDKNELLFWFEDALYVAHQPISTIILDLEVDLMDLDNSRDLVKKQIEELRNV